MKKFLISLFAIVILFSVLPNQVIADTTKDAIDEQSIINGTQKLTYELMGAKGDGVTNDFASIMETHKLANRLYLQSGKMITVYGQSDSTYYISTSDGLAENKSVIDVATNVDWQGCTFIFDDYLDENNDGVNDIYFHQPIFDVVSDMKAASGWSVSIEFSESRDSSLPNPEFPAVSAVVISKTTTNVHHLIDAVKNGYVYNRYPDVKADYDKCRIWGAYIEDNTKRWIRKGSNQNSGDYTSEMITFDSITGELLTTLDFDYDNLRMIRVFPIRNEGISIGNATIITRTNNKVYPSGTKEPYTYRGIRVRYTGNVILHNINHILDESAHPFTSSYQSDPNVNYYDGIIDLQNDAYIRMDSVNFQAHKPSAKPGSTTSFEGTYDISVKCVAYLYMNDICYTDYDSDMTDTDRWGVINTNMCKNVFVSSSKLNRIDAHRGITNLYITDSLFGAHGLTLMGQSNFYGEKIAFDQAVRPVQLRQDYGACWNGNMYFDDISFFLPYNPEPYTFSYLVYAFNTENWNFGYRSYFPNIYMDDMYLGGTDKTRVVMLQICDTLKKTYDNSDPDNLYYFKGDVMMKNITTDSNIEYMRVFVNEFAKDSFNLQRTNYGGTNTVTLDIDSEVQKNIGSVSDPKFVTGTVTVSFAEPKEQILRLREKGLTVINGSYDNIPAISLELDREVLELETGEAELLHGIIMPRVADQHIVYTSGDEAIAKVDQNGKVTAVSRGATYVTATSKDGSVSARCLVIVDSGSVLRIYGADRYATSLKAARYLLELKGVSKFDNIVITTGENYADALSGSYLANLFGAPVLLIKDRTSVKKNVVNFIKNYLKQDGTVYILGGDAVVKDEWLSGISQKIKRLSGDTRYITNIEILKEIGYSGNEILVCSATGFADSLSASAVERPILLVGNALKKDQKNYLKGFSGKCVFIPVGGDKAVSSEVLNELAQYGTVMDRLQGEDRYSTSAAIAERFFPQGKMAVLAYGKTFPDGLSAGPLAYALNAPLLLVTSSNSNTKAAMNYCKSKNIHKGLVLGGAGLISDRFANRVFDLAEGNAAIDYE